MSNSVSKCPICGKIGKVVKSNNPIVPGVCDKCLNEQFDYSNLKQANFFCRTYNLPFLPDRWIEIANEAKFDTFDIYTTVIGDEYPNTLYNGEATGDLWDEMDKEWKKCRTHEELLSKIKPIKEDFMTRMQIKWGTEYTFEQFISLEHLYTNTVQSIGTTNTLTLDTIKKVAIVSIKMDECLRYGEVKEAAEYSKMLKTLTDSAGLGDIIEVGNSETILTLSDLCDYLESTDNGDEFVLNFYDNVPRDIVDKTIQDNQEYIRNFVLGSTGIQQSYEIIENTYKQQLENDKTEKAYKETNLDELLDMAKKGVNQEFDEQLDAENFDFDWDEVNDPA